MVDRRTDRRTYFHIGMYIGGQRDGRTDTQKDIRQTETFKHTVELQWLEHLWNHENKFETGVARANECYS